MTAAVTLKKRGRPTIYNFGSLELNEIKNIRSDDVNTVRVAAAAWGKRQNPIRKFSVLSGMMGRVPVAVVKRTA